MESESASDTGSSSLVSGFFRTGPTTLFSSSSILALAMAARSSTAWNIEINWVISRPSLLTTLQGPAYWAFVYLSSFARHSIRLFAQVRSRVNPTQDTASQAQVSLV